jgi:bla regulator protein BlaR1
MRKTMMASLNNWLSADILHALGWALIHSLWQGVVVAALAALLMAVFRRPAVRYLVGIGALILMLTAPAATFLVLVKPVAQIQTTSRAGSAYPHPADLSIRAARETVMVVPMTVLSNAIERRAAAAIAETPRPLPNFLPWLVSAWLCGVAFFSLRFAGAFLLLERRRRGQSRTLSPHILAICLELQ